MNPDTRIPVRLASRPGESGAAGATTLVILDARIAGLTASPHRLVAFGAHEGAGLGTRSGGRCVCCAGRASFATALGRLFAERASGEVPFFTEIEAVSDAAGQGAACAALASDPFLLSRYRLSGMS